MNITMKKFLKVLLILFVIAALAGLTVRFASLALHWQETLEHARSTLFLWRLSLYGLLAVMWLSLLRRWKKYSPAHRPALRRMTGWTVALVVLCEISNALQGAGTP